MCPQRARSRLPGAHPRYVKRAYRFPARLFAGGSYIRLYGGPLVFVALGDTWMKLPASYSRRALRKRHQFFAAGLADDHIDRLLTPPYVSNKPQVLHHRLRRTIHKAPAEWPPASASASVIDIDADAASVRADIALILCSDGLVDSYEEQGIQEKRYMAQWAAQIGDALALGGRQRGGPLPGDDNTSSSAGVGARVKRPDRSDEPLEMPGQQGNGSAVNLAVHLLREAIGGADIHRVSANLTVEMDERWMDDTTIIVHRFS